MNFVHNILDILSKCCLQNMKVNTISEFFPNTGNIGTKTLWVLTLTVAANKSISPLIFNFKLLKSISSSLKTFD